MLGKPRVEYAGALYQVLPADRDQTPLYFGWSEGRQFRQITAVTARPIRPRP